MHIRWLEDFVCLAQAGSLARAAELRNVTPPAFGRRMQAVEVWAGAPLIDRSVFPVRLTAEGRQFLEAAQGALRTLDETRLALRAAHRADASTVTIATGKTLARSMVPAWLSALREALRGDPAAAGFRTRLSTFPMHDALAMFAEGDADFLLCYSPPDLPVMLDDARYQFHLAGVERLVCVSAADAHGAPLHRLRTGKAAGQKPVPMIAYAETLTLGRMVNQEIARRKLAPRLDVIAVSDFAESVHEMVRQRMGLAWLPARLIADDLHAGRLVRAIGATAAGADAGGDLALDIRLYRPRAPMRPLAEAFWRAAVAAPR
ncbi:LysR family transcriptional regulator [Cupriavidus oxalaticus]|jgi:DNA-binding transcriptional LysR family regulator|uniref:LysR family transcriptional regulator n=1 Tax=Cupriavidus oxalaticus TaxID=96344 RepID=A0A375FYK9_9BURK|nr:LysR substrate-binding domain-containing protein [Cupriavidus oxalaticus]QEZ48335.1 LysR family transcriptional regulator [Cupriavidus oxalaticus]QRQ87384.1 LysR family transcriptional regulator [Cupriavidus oxalaticus]QRQ94288.1 LysR family transcriptional regulator [Cupriavidus oxalaticus]WQD82928.1 LysR substrate-binding domain-containing protein [Cupriavidus oxalaticus]SPC10856.1 Transcriptional regulator LysR family [Cupriavidus oxalaticus]